MTSSDNSDVLLWELVQLGDEDGDERPSDALLNAYRRGELEPESAAALEALLFRSAAARERLTELAGLARSSPPLAGREQFLEAFSATVTARKRESSSRFQRHWLPLAAALALAVAAALFWRQGGPAPLPEDAVFDVTATGRSKDRSEPAGAAATEAFPDTTVRIAVAPRDLAVEGLAVGLYRLRRAPSPGAGTVLERVSPRARVTVTEDRGATLFEARARDLVGTEAGVHELVVVVARQGDLPRGRELVGGADEWMASLAEGERRRIYPLQVLLLEAPQPDEEERR